MAGGEMGVVGKWPGRPPLEQPSLELRPGLGLGRAMQGGGVSTATPSFDFVLEPTSDSRPSQPKPSLFADLR